MPTKKTPNEAAKALAELSRKKRLRTMTAEQRSEQGRRAVAARRDRQPKGPWYGLVLLPADYQWQGVRHAAKVLDAAHADTGNVLFWSHDRAEVVQRSQGPDLRGRDTLIVEQHWDPRAFTVQRTFEANPERLKQLLRVARSSMEGGRA